MHANTHFWAVVQHLHCPCTHAHNRLCAASAPSPNLTITCAVQSVVSAASPRSTTQLSARMPYNPSEAGLSPGRGDGSLSARVRVRRELPEARFVHLGACLCIPSHFRSSPWHTLNALAHADCSCFLQYIRRVSAAFAAFVCFVRCMSSVVCVQNVMHISVG